ncbi:MAG: hypothetical protein AAF735_05345 [Myxococcota bacterium]
MRFSRGSQRGLGTVGKLIAVAVLTSVGYAGATLVPVWLLEFRITQAARSIANRAVTGDRSTYLLRQDFVSDVERITDVRLSTADIQIERNYEGDEVTVRLDYELPIEFPWIDRSEPRHVQAEIVMTRSRAY